MLAWHFLNSDTKLGYGDDRIVSVGETLKVDPEKLKLCEYGLHASVKILDALTYIREGNDAIVCRVKLGGNIIEGVDKCVASERTVLSWCKAGKFLRDFRYVFADDLLSVFEKEYPENNSCRRYLEAKQMWYNGKITDVEVEAAWKIAWNTLRPMETTKPVWAAVGALTIIATETWHVAGCGAAWICYGTAWDEAKEKYNLYLENRVWENI